MSKKNCAGTATVAEKRSMINQMKSETGLKMALQAVGLSKSIYYYAGKEKRAGQRQEYPLDPVLTNILLSFKGYELTLEYKRVMYYIDFPLKQGHCNQKKFFRHMYELIFLVIAMA